MYLDDQTNIFRGKKPCANAFVKVFVIALSIQYLCDCPLDVLVTVHVIVLCEYLPHIVRMLYEESSLASKGKILCGECRVEFILPSKRRISTVFIQCIHIDFLVFFFDCVCVPTFG